jgi:prepilin-type N-terminal cleavage/methylation domain-containing protein
MSPKRAGFTLIELLIVVVIIGILASIAIPKFSAVREKAFFAAMKSDLKNLANLQDVYYNDNYSYSTDAAALGFTNSEGVVITLSEGTNTGWSATASHLGAQLEQCGIYHGDAALVTPAVVADRVACTG